MKCEAGCKTLKKKGSVQHLFLTNRRNRVVQTDFFQSARAAHVVDSPKAGNLDLNGCFCRSVRHM